MSENTRRQPVPSEDEGGLRAPPGLGPLGKLWWWFHFLILVKLARLRFIAILVFIGLVIVKWDTILAYYDKWTRPAVTTEAARSDIEYFCPMHPTVIRDNSREKCPICFMPLSRRKKGEAKDEALPPGIVNRVQLSPYRVVLAGIKTWKVAHVPLVKEITTVGFVEFNERMVKQVAARVKGRLDKLLVNQHGQMVHEGQELASLYSPDLVVTVQNLIDARKSGNPELLRISRDRLNLWGIGDAQIEEILKTGKANSHLQIRSPIHGHVIKKYVEEGQYVEEGMPLYRLADLSTIWIEAQVYESDLTFLPHSKDGESGKEGLPVTALTEGFPGESFTGKLAFVYPHVNQEARTIVARFELDNADHKLRPGMTATVKLNVAPSGMGLFARTNAEDSLKDAATDLAANALLGNSIARPGIVPLFLDVQRRALLRQGWLLAVPEGSVIDTGSLKLVYREVVPGEYEGVSVQLGGRMAGPDGVAYYPVLQGVQAGDVLVTAGSFLVDAETRLNPAAGSIYFGGSGGKEGTSTSFGVRPSTPNEAAIVKEAFAKLATDEDRRLAEKQYFCPIQKDSRLGLMGTPVKLFVQEQLVYLCCEGCRRGALADPRDTLEKLDRIKQARRVTSSK